MKKISVYKNILKEKFTEKEKGFLKDRESKCPTRDFILNTYL
jgi:hypothetical protein